MVEKTSKPLVSLIVAMYNEEALLKKNFDLLFAYTKALNERYKWEYILINDGSKDGTGKIVDQIAAEYPNIIVCHHLKNLGLGQSLQDGFELSSGDYVITFDIDLSYSPHHIKELLDNIEDTGAKVVVASPMMTGGKMSNVPFVRRFFSEAANYLLKIFSRRTVSCLTGMVRVYDGDFIRSINLRSRGKDLMPEIIHKAMITNSEITEIPGHLDWSQINDPGLKRPSTTKIFSHTVSTMFTGFLLHPFFFFILPGILLLLFSFYPNLWMVRHVLVEYSALSGDPVNHDFSTALAFAYKKHPHTFHTGLLTLLISLQLMALGFISLQNKYYFEELYSLGIKIKRQREKKTK